MKVLIAGCGYVGKRAAELFVESGASVWGVTRRAQVLPPGVTPIQADLTDSSTFHEFPSDITHIVYGAAAADRSERAYQDAYVTGVRNVLAWAKERSVERFLFTSSTGVYHHNKGEWVDESSKVLPLNFTGRTVLEGEHLVLSKAKTPIVLRFGGIYGPGRTYAVDRVRCGVAVMPHEVMQFTNRIHREDCARAIHYLLSLDAPDSIYLGVDDAPVSQSELATFLAAQLGIALPKIEGENPISGKRCSNKKLRDTGFQFTFPTYREGYTALLAEG